MNDNSLDLTMAEIKKGEIAEAYDLLKDNMDIDIYVWANTYKEDNTDKFNIKYNDIMQALKDEKNYE